MLKYAPGSVFVSLLFVGLLACEQASAQSGDFHSDSPVGRVNGSPGEWYQDPSDVEVTGRAQFSLPGTSGSQNWEFRIRVEVSHSGTSVGTHLSSILQLAPMSSGTVYIPYNKKTTTGLPYQYSFDIYLEGREVGTTPWQLLNQDYRGFYSD